MKIAVDKNQLSGSHAVSNKKKHEQLKRLGVELCPLPLAFGDYALIDDDVQAVIDKKGKKITKKDLQDVIKKAVDTKKDLAEVHMNVSSKQHERFRRELIKANGRLTLLIEDSSVSDLEDVFFYESEPKTRYKWTTKVVAGKSYKCRVPYTQNGINGKTLYKSLKTIRDRYDVNIDFCTRDNAGEKIIEIFKN